MDLQDKQEPSAFTCFDRKGPCTASFLLPCCYESNLRQIKSCPSFTTQTDTNNLRYYKVYCARQDDRILIFDLITENLLLNSVDHERSEQTF